MTFEPLYLHQHVLNFYRRSGTVGSSADRVSLVFQGPQRIHGSGQHFEQSLYMLLGHLLPQWDPLVGDLTITPSDLMLSYRLPLLGQPNTKALAKIIQEDTFFQQLLQAAEARVSMEIPSAESECAQICLRFPIGKPGISRNTEIINLKELEKRFDSLDEALPILEWFVNNARKNVLSMQENLNNGNWTEAHRLAHSLKGGALNTGANHFAHAARDVELALKEKRFTSIPEYVEHLLSACADLESVWEDVHGDLYG